MNVGNGVPFSAARRPGAESHLLQSLEARDVAVVYHVYRSAVHVVKLANKQAVPGEVVLLRASV